MSYGRMGTQATGILRVVVQKRQCKTEAAMDQDHLA